jgi:hypothetical protein
MDVRVHVRELLRRRTMRQLWTWGLLRNYFLSSEALSLYIGPGVRRTDDLDSQANLRGYSPST